jgi:hypothetical protein
MTERSARQLMETAVEGGQISGSMEVTGRTVVKRMASEAEARSVEDGRQHGEQRDDKHVTSNRVLLQQKDRRGDNVAWQAASGNKHLNVVCRAASEGDPVDRRGKDDGGGHDQRDDKQVQQQQTGGGWATAAHDGRLLYDFSLFSIRQMLLCWEKDYWITEAWNIWNASQEENMRCRSTILARAMAAARREGKRQFRKPQSIRKRAELLDAIKYGKKERARSSKDGCTRWRYE